MSKLRGNSKFLLHRIGRPKEARVTKQIDCIVCEEPILEADKHCTGDEVVFFEGDCQGWLHRRCAGITHPTLGESNKVYLCSYCMSVNQSNEISKLSSIISNLNSAYNFFD